MRKSIISAVVILALVTGTTRLSAQNRSAEGTAYRNAIGLGIDFGDGATLVGPSFKHFFSENNVGKGEILFGNGFTMIQGFYEYHKEIENAPGLRWFAGAGAGAAIADNNSSFMLRPTGGLDYKIDDVPLSFSFDWRPTFFIREDPEFTAARFGIGIRYAFN